MLDAENQILNQAFEQLLIYLILVIKVIIMLENVKKSHKKQIPSTITLDCAEFWFNTPNNISVLSEYQLGGIKEVREHNYSNKHEYNLDGEIINEEDIIGCNGDFYLGWYTEIAYIQLYVPYRCDDFTIIRYRSADKDARQGEWNSDIKFIVHHNEKICRNAERNVAFRQLMELASELKKFGWDDFNRIIGCDFCENSDTDFAKLHYKRTSWEDNDEIIEDDEIIEIE